MNFSKILLTTAFFSFSSVTMASENSLSLDPCPESPNCVSSLENPNSTQHYIEPLFAESIEDLNILKEVLADLKGFKLTQETDSYLRYEFTSRVFRFVDDVEFLFIENSELRTGYIHMRSSSRVGYSDFGANRKRLEKIQELWKAQ